MKEKTVRVSIPETAAHRIVAEYGAALALARPDPASHAVEVHKENWRSK